MVSCHCSSQQYYRSALWLPFAVSGMGIAVWVVTRNATTLVDGPYRYLSTGGRIIAFLALYSLPAYTPFFVAMRWWLKRPQSIKRIRTVLWLLPLAISAAFAAAVWIKNALERREATNAAVFVFVCGLMLGYIYAVAIELCRALLQARLKDPPLIT